MSYVNDIFQSGFAVCDGGMGEEESHWCTDPKGNSVFFVLIYLIYLSIEQTEHVSP